LGQTCCIACVQVAQKVHSKEQMKARPCGASAPAHFSQLFFIFSMAASPGGAVNSPQDYHAVEHAVEHAVAHGDCARVSVPRAGEPAALPPPCAWR
jgi:hypothetical protein